MTKIQAPRSSARASTNRPRRMARPAPEASNDQSPAEQLAAPKQPAAPADAAIASVAANSETSSAEEGADASFNPTKSTKASIVLALLQRDEGATISDLVTATGWLPHTARAHLTGLRHKGHALLSEKTGDVRRYRIAATTRRGK